MKRLLSLLSAALTVLFVVGSVLPASAATRGTPSSSGLSIIPRINLEVSPGKTVASKLVIGNLSHTADLNINLRLIDFTFTNSSGVPKLFLAQNAPQTTWSLKPFVNLPADVVVPAGQTKTIPFNVTIPKGQGAGSYYSAVEYQAGGTNGGSVSLNASGVSLIFVSIPGIVHEDMTLQKFGAYQSRDGGVSGGFAYVNTIMPQFVAYSFKNNGNVAESPTGSITIHDMWGNKVTTISSINPNSSLALIGQTRLFTSCIKAAQTSVNLSGETTQSQTCVNPHLKPGLYTVNLDAFYGQNGNQTKEITASGSFWYLPWWVIVVVLALVLLILFFVLRIYFKLRKHRNSPQAQRARKFKLGRR